MKLINLDTAKLAKEKDFDEECDYYYNSNNELQKAQYFEFDINNLTGIHSIADVLCTAPRQSELQTWLRNEHNIQVYAYSDTRNMLGRFIDWVYTVHTPNSRFDLDARDGCISYEVAMEFGLQKALNLIK